MVEVSVAIPTYRREGVLLDTLNQLLALKHRACEILVVDQTPEHEFSTISALEKLEEDGSIIWHRLQIPSIPKAMNHALLTARHEVVLFLDDDVELTSELVREHAKEHDGPNVTCVAGGVVQLWHRKLDESEDITNEYVKEIHVLENENLKRSEGAFKYPSWERKNGFSSKDIARFLI